MAVLAIDCSALTSVAAFRCTKDQGFKRVIIRGYREAYGRNPGGMIDQNFLQNYKNAREAGYTYIDLYMFPCTGRPTCKSPQEQVNELVRFIRNNKVIVQTIWLDVEIDNEAHNWEMGMTKNRQVLREFYNAWKSTGLKFGIYSSHRQWRRVVGEQNWVLDSNLPLWYSIGDNDPTLDNFIPFGGWSRGTVKQYSTEGLCGAKFDRNVFRQ